MLLLLLCGLPCVFFGNRPSAKLFGLIVDLELVLVEQADELGLNENVLIVNFGAVDLESEFLRFELRREVEPGHHSHRAHDHGLLLLGLVSFGFVFIHEIKYQQHVPPIHHHVHPVLVALELILPYFYVQLVPSQDLLHRPLELVTRQNPYPRNLRPAQLNRRPLSLGGSGFRSHRWLLADVDQLLHHRY